MHTRGVLGEARGLGRCWGEEELAAKAWWVEEPDSAWRTRAPGWMSEGPYLAVAPRPANKYLTFQAYLEGAGPGKRHFPPPPGMIGLALPGVGTSGQVRWAVQRAAAADTLYIPRANAGRPNPLDSERFTSYSL